MLVCPLMPPRFHGTQQPKLAFASSPATWRSVLHSHHSAVHALGIMGAIQYCPWRTISCDSSSKTRGKSPLPGPDQQDLLPTANVWRPNATCLLSSLPDLHGFPSPRLKASRSFCNLVAWFSSRFMVVSLAMKMLKRACRTSSLPNMSSPWLLQAVFSSLHNLMVRMPINHLKERTALASEQSRRHDDGLTSSAGLYKGTHHSAGSRSLPS